MWQLLDIPTAFVSMVGLNKRGVSDFQSATPLWEKSGTGRLAELQS